MGQIRFATCPWCGKAGVWVNPDATMWKHVRVFDAGGKRTCEGSGKRVSDHGKVGPR